MAPPRQGSVRFPALRAGVNDLKGWSRSVSHSPDREPFQTSSVAVTSNRLDLEALTAAVASGIGADGAVASFAGLVRQANLGRQVAYLEYEAYEPLAVRA